jgi:phage shock protein PspC (stress-responsive transcriptional regulator)
MKKALKINLSGQIFHIDEDAYEKLKVYLDTIGSHFSNANESSEIMSDIESRIAELFKGKMTDENQVITLKEVNEIIDIMGRPEEIASDDQPEPHESNRSKRQNRRLYRDPENSVFGGVCSGLAAYFNLDILLVRVLFIVLTIVGGGLPIFLYLVLWIAVPKALSAAQKLEMRGEKITVSNIEKTVREEYESVKDNLKKARTSESYRRTEDFFTRFLHVIGVIVLAILKIVLGFIAVVFIILGISILFGALGFAFLGVSSLPFHMNHNIDMNFPDLIQPFFNPANVNMVVFAVSILILIPVIAIIYALFKLIFRFKGRDKTLGLAAVTIWVLALITTFGLVYYEGRNYKENEAVNITKPIENLSGDTLYISMNSLLPEGWEDGKSFEINNDWLFRKDMKEIIGTVKIDINRSYDKNFKLRVNKVSRGLSQDIASEMAGKIMYNYTQQHDSLKFDSYFKLEENSPWRMQKVEVTIFVPEGKAIHLNKNTSEYLNDVENAENIYDEDMSDHTWIMKPDGLSWTIGN